MAFRIPSFVLGVVLVVSVSSCKVTSKQAEVPEIQVGNNEPLFPKGTTMSSSWTGSCVGSTEPDLSLLLQKDGAWSLTSVKNSDNFSSESGKYSVNNSSVSFFESLGLRQTMSCDLRALSGSKSLTCSLLDGNNLAFFQKCKQASFVLINPEPIPGPSEGSTKLPPVVTETGGVPMFPTGPTASDDACKGQDPGSLSETLLGPCGVDRELSIALSANGTFVSTLSIYKREGKYCSDSKKNLTFVSNLPENETMKCSKTTVEGEFVCTGFTGCLASIKVKSP